MPAHIAATKTKAELEPYPTAVSAGPGQKPASPQPIPKMAGPRMILASMSFRVGMWKRSAKNGRASFRTRLKPMKVTTTAPAITKARLASTSPRTSAQIQKIQYLRRVRHPGDDEPEAED